jgi:hypothetical protein
MGHIKVLFFLKLNCFVLYQIIVGLGAFRLKCVLQYRVHKTCRDMQKITVKLDGTRKFLLPLCLLHFFQFSMSMMSIIDKEVSRLFLYSVILANSPPWHHAIYFLVRYLFQNGLYSSRMKSSTGGAGSATKNSLI